LALIVAIFTVYITLKTNRAIARRKATIDFLLTKQTNEWMLKQRQQFIKLRQSQTLMNWVARAQSDSDEQRAILVVLNSAEYVAIGILNDTFDESLYKDAFRTTYVQDWMDLKPFVKALRSANQAPDAFIKMEGMAQKWATKDENRKIAAI